MEESVFVCIVTGKGAVRKAVDMLHALNICKYIYMDIYIYVKIYVCTCVCMCVCVCVRVFVYTGKQFKAFVQRISTQGP